MEYGPQMGEQKEGGWGVGEQKEGGGRRENKVGSTIP